MPELPDITVYTEAVSKRTVGRPLERLRLNSPFLLRTFDPPTSDVEGKTVRELRRLGKRIAIGLDGELWLVIHLMIAGRLHWKPPGAKLAAKYFLAAFDFPGGSLLFSEAGSRKLASLHIVRGEAALDAHDPGGLEIFSATPDEFAATLRAKNRTVKNTLTDPKTFSGIGNAYADEILHRARLSPLTLAKKLSDAEADRLFAAVKDVMREWTDRLRAEAGDNFPEKVTAFRPEMAVHGKFGQPCPVCSAPVQRIKYADNETNYCAGCQTDGRLLADRGMSRLLNDDRPKHLDDLR